jgi:dTDP-4-dehydrorhamnose 3,5-epimerase
MEVLDTEIQEVKTLRPKRFADARGFFSEIFVASRIEQALGRSLHFVQDNMSHSSVPGTVRGVHFQARPFAQDKLIATLRGAILDVAVDLRVGSPTFGKSVARRLDAENGLQLFIPVGFGHGFCTLEPDTIVLYKVTAPYAASHDFGVRWDDPDLAIKWPVRPSEAVLSPKDIKQPMLRELPAYFRFEDF